MIINSDKMNFAQEKLMIIEHFKKLQRNGYQFNIIGDNRDNVVLYDSYLAGKFFIKPIPITSPIDLLSRTVYECKFQEIEYSVATPWQIYHADQLIAKNGHYDIACNVKSTLMISPCHSFEEVEKAFFKYINDLKVKMKVFQIKQIGANEDDY